MAIARETVAKNVKPLEGANVRRFIAGSAIEVGEAVSMSSDGYIDPAIGTGLAGIKTMGIALPSRNGGGAYAAGDMVDVVTFGAVQCVTGATPGSTVFVSDTAGEVAESAGTKSGVVGIAISATVVFVNPYQVAWA